MLEKIKTLVEDGATVLGNPPSKAPGLSGYPESDARVKMAAAKLWGAGAKTGKGRVLTGKTPAEALADIKVRPDFVSNKNIRYIHRALDGGDLYFVANPGSMPVDALCTFRVSGMVPEAWFPDSGLIEPLTAYSEADGCTRIPLRFEPSGSLFVVFKKGRVGAVRQMVSVTRDGHGLLDMRLDGAIVGDPEVTQTFTMAAWVKPNAVIALPQETNDGISAVNIERNDVVYPPPGHEVWKQQDAGAGFGVGSNGVCVHEHGDFYFPPLLVHAAPLDGWTHVAVVYQDGTPSLYLNGKFARSGLKSKKTAHPGVGVSHGRELKAFNGQIAGLQQFPTALAAGEIAKLARTKPAVSDIAQGPALDPVTREIAQRGGYVIRTADGQTLTLDLSKLPAPVEIVGPWDVGFAPGWGAPAKITLDHLVSWSEHADGGVKYFSGSATYRKSFAYTPAPPFPPGVATRVWLDLGKVAVMAAVKLNGRDLGILWKPPYRVDITETIKAGGNLLEVRVVNLPINRMLGDELLPEDSERNGDGTLKKWPQWLLDGKPSPGGRFTFTSWRLWKKDEPLQESGLLGPVSVSTVAKIGLQ
jgi:hypothetical protein